MITEYGTIVTSIDPSLFDPEMFDQAAMDEIMRALREEAQEIAEKEEGGLLEGPPNLCKGIFYYNHLIWPAYRTIK